MIYDKKMKGRGMMIKGSLLLFASLLATFMLHGQAVDTLSLKDAVNSALTSHPAVKAAELGVEQQHKLKKTAFSLDPTRLNYSRGQLNAEVTDYQWQLSQGFKFPTAYVAQSKLQREQVNLSERRLTMTQVEVELQVRQAWWILAFHEEKLASLAELADQYKGFAEAASKRYAAGETNILEKTSAEGQYQKMLLAQQQAEADVKISQQQLQRWLGNDSSFVMPVRALTRFTDLAQATTGSGSNPGLQIMAQQKAVAEQQIKVARHGYLPDFSLGYLNQQIEGSSGLTAAQFGIGIPIFFWGQRGKVQAAKLQEEIVTQTYEAEHLKVNSEMEQTAQTLEKHRLQLAWYQDHGLPTAKELVRYGRQGYQAGEIGYLEYIGSLQQATTIRLDYLQALNAYHQTASVWQYLNGKFED